LGRRFDWLVVLLACVLAACSSGGGSKGASARGGPTGGAPVGTSRVGRQSDGAVVTPSGQLVTPAGTQVDFAGRPLAVAIRPDGRTAAFLSGTSIQAGTAPLLTVVDLATAKVVQQLRPAASGVASFGGIVYAPDGKRLYASAIDAVVEASVAADGSLTTGRRLLVGQYPTGLAVSSDGATLYAALNTKNAVAIVDLASGAVRAQVPVGNAPQAVLVVGTKLYVANQGGRVAGRGDHTNLSSGTKVVADANTGAVNNGTVSVIDLKTNRVSTVNVGLQPTALAAHNGFVYVANTNSDSVSVIDSASGQVVTTFAAEPSPGVGTGSAPTGLEFLSDGRLVVSLGRDNALAVYRVTKPTEPAALEGLLPTGWYPAGLAVNPGGTKVVVANADGIGTLGPVGKSLQELIYNDLGRSVTSHTVTAWVGSASIIPVPDAAALTAGTRAVAHDNGWDALDHASARSGVAPVPVPIHVGEPSTIKKVVYIIKENRTYDQVLGDDSRGNGDPRLVQFGPKITPNHHAIARRWVLLDNFYSAGAVSADGHQWVTQADDPDYVERMLSAFPAGRSYPSNGGDALAYLPSGFLWDNAQRHGRTVQVFGEYAKEGVTPATSDIPSLDKALIRDYPPFDLSIPDQHRADVFLRSLRDWQRSGNMPDLAIVHLPNDHTTGTTPSYPTPQAQVADNDLALGRILTGLSKSKFWPETAVFVVEDDAQFGVDHVDGHRTVALIASPYATRAKVDSTFYTQVNLVRTIEQILGLPPMNRMDVAATPMFDAFATTPDASPYQTLTPAVLGTVNKPASALHGAPEKAWAEASARMNFAVPDVEANRPLLNRLIWYATKGYNTPYPGDPHAYLPDQVPHDGS
jgi:YVTN family beta-propeller protein